MKRMQQLFTLLFGLTIVSCSTMNQGQKGNFLLKEAHYQTSLLDGQSAVTVLTILVEDVSESVSFDNIIYHRDKLPVDVKKQDDGSIKISAIFQPGDVAIQSVVPEKVNLSDRLIFSISGKQDFIQITDWERLPTMIR